MSQKRILLWFRNDLRLEDNETLYKASQKSNYIIPVYCFDPRQFQETKLGFPKTGKYRAKFLIESVENLKQNLRAIGSDLLIRFGKPEDIILKLVQELGVEMVYASKEVTSEETNMEQKLEQNLWKQGVSLEMFWTSTLYHLDDLPLPVNNLPDVFTQFRKKVEKFASVRELYPKPNVLIGLQGIDLGKIPSLQDLGLPSFEPNPKAVLEFKGGEGEAQKRVENYIWTQDLLRQYKETRNRLLGAEYSSKLSAWLALGCISAKQVYVEVKKYEKERIQNKSTYWLIFELIWRDYFRFVAKKYGNLIFKVTGIQDKEISYSNHLSFFEQWANAETGIPFIDANMQELKETGFMSNRGRQNVASFLTKDLKINWTYGAMYFESLLIDYDVCSNWCNWCYVAGVRNDPRENRYFNISKQAQNYDPQGKYVKYWLPSVDN